MTIDMGGIAWPLRTQSQSRATSGVRVGSAKLDRQLAYAGNDVQVTATGTDGQPYTGPLHVTLTGSDEELYRVAGSGTFSTDGVPPGRYLVTVNGVTVGNLRVL